jgi:hypothetical protein
LAQESRPIDFGTAGIAGSALYFYTLQKITDLCFELGTEAVVLVANESADNFVYSKKQLIYALNFA